MLEHIFTRINGIEWNKTTHFRENTGQASYINQTQVNYTYISQLGSIYVDMHVLQHGRLIKNLWGLEHAAYEQHHSSSQ